MKVEQVGQLVFPVSPTWLCVLEACLQTVAGGGGSRPAITGQYCSKEKQTSPHSLPGVIFR